MAESPVLRGTDRRLPKSYYEGIEILRGDNEKVAVSRSDSRICDHLSPDGYHLLCGGWLF